jgi:hypothetical protein
MIMVDEDYHGVDLISLVDAPAIEENWIALNGDVRLQLADQDKQLLIGAALVPLKPIYRRNSEGEEYYIHFSKETIEKTAYRFMRHGLLGNTNLQHDEKLNGNTVVESWLVMDERDKAYALGLNPPIGTWMVAMQVEDKQFWDEYVKTGKVKGFSIEGEFASRIYLDKANIKTDNRHKNGKRIEMESYSDYPDAVKNNAKRGIELNEKNGNRCGTQVGKVRAQQLAKGEAVSFETVKRMYSYLSRAAEYYDEGDTSACGTISYLMWGGKAALQWAEGIVSEQDEEGVAMIAHDFLMDFVGLDDDE